MLTALSIHLFNVENIFVAFLRVSQRAFWPKRFFLLIGFIFSYLEIFLVVFYLSFNFILAQDASARNLGQFPWLLVSDGHGHCVRRRPTPSRAPCASGRGTSDSSQ